MKSFTTLCTRFLLVALSACSVSKVPAMDTDAGSPGADADPQIPVGHHSPEKHDVHFNFVTFIQETQRISHLELEVMLFDFRLHLDLLEVDGLLILSGRVLSFALLILEFSKIHHAAYRRIGLRGDFHQVHPGIHGLLKRIIYAQNTNLTAFSINDSDFRNVNLFVHPRTVVMLNGRF